MCVLPFAQQSLKTNGLHFGRVPEYAALSAASCLSELCALFDLTLPATAVDITSTSKTLKIISKRKESDAAGKAGGVVKKTKVEDLSGSGSGSAGVDGRPDVRPVILPATDLR